MSKIDLGQILEQNEMPSHSDLFCIAGDVSATNILIELFAVKNKQSHTVLKVKYDGKKVTHFNNQVLNHLLRKAKVKATSIDRMVLSPAGPIVDGACKVTNANYSINAREIIIPTALINDFAAIAYAVADVHNRNKPSDLEVLSLKHLNGQEGQAKFQANIGILGAGTGLGTSRIHFRRNMGAQFNDGKGLYVPVSSEGGHRYLPIKPGDGLENEIAAYLAVKLGVDIPHLEAVLSGQGVVDVYEFSCGTRMRTPNYDGATTVNDKVGVIARNAKKGDPKAKLTMDFFWDIYSRAAHDVIVHENAWGGLYVAGGSIRKDILDNGVVDENIRQRFMYSIDNSPSHKELVGDTPINIVRDKEIGLKGTKYFASSDFFEHEKYAA